MIEANTIQAMRELVGPWRRAGEVVGFVPTMGNLHDGHIALVKEAKRHAARIVVSIFVNPMQFDRKEDLEAYPRTVAADFAKLREAGVDAVFLPNNAMLYPQGLDDMTQVSVPRITARLEGASRPGHFVGVSTVVTKLFNIVQPDLAVFGEKDFQQLAIIRKMTRDLDLPVEIVALPTVRNEDGLAMSSRNGYLTAEERVIAPILNRTMRALVEEARKDGADFRLLEQRGMADLTAAGFRPDYIELCHADTLLPAEYGDRSLVLLASAWLGSRARLIDNIPFTLD